MGDSHKLTVKQEAFCLAYIETGNAAKAYRQAYEADNMKDQTVWTEASKLLNHPYVTPRIKELQDQYADLNRVTVESLTRELTEAQDMARDVGNPAAFVNAAMGKAKLHGLFVKKIEAEVGYVITPESMKATRDEIQARFDKLMKAKEDEDK